MKRLLLFLLVSQGFCDLYGPNLPPVPAVFQDCTMVENLSIECGRNSIFDPSADLQSKFKDMMQQVLQKAIVACALDCITGMAVGGGGNPFGGGAGGNPFSGAGNLIPSGGGDAGGGLEALLPFLGKKRRRKRQLDSTCMDCIVTQMMGDGTLESGMAEAKQMSAGICPALANKWDDMESCVKQAQQMVQPKEITSIDGLMKATGMPSFGMQSMDFLPPDIAGKVTPSMDLMEIMKLMVQPGGGVPQIPGGIPNIPGGIPSIPGIPNVNPGIPNVNPGIPNVNPGVPNIPTNNGIPDWNNFSGRKK